MKKTSLLITAIFTFFIFFVGSVFAGNATFLNHVDYSSYGSLNLASGDFNSDGNIDIVSANWGAFNKIGVFLGIGNGTFNTKVDYTTGSDVFDVSVADFNSDGKIDIVTSNQGGNSISVFIGVGNGTFNTKVDYAAGTRPESVTTGDFNGDGNIDIVAGNYSNANASVFIGVGNGTFNTKVDYAVGTGPSNLITGDFNSDGNLDLVSANYSSSTISVLLGVGNGTFNTKVDYAAGSGSGDLAIGDFNSDGNLDLAVANYLASNVSVLLGVGNGTFNTKVDYAVGGSPYGVVVGDINLDGVNDLITKNSSVTYSLSVLSGVGNGTFNTKVDYNSTIIGTDGRDLILGDFNEDNKIDIATPAYSNNMISIIINSTLRDTKAITAFTIPNQVGDTTIDEDNKTVSITMPYGTDVSALVPTITHTGSSTSPATGVATDFSSPATYTVTAENSTTQEYVVTVTSEEAPPVVLSTPVSETVSGSSASSRLNSLIGDNKDSVEHVLAALIKIWPDLFLNSNSTPETNSSDHTFRRDLYVGVEGEDVRQLQIFLNRNGFVLSQVGPGSQGNETTKFGNLTRSALIKFQKENGILPSLGYFGPKTRAVIESI